MNNFGLHLLFKLLFDNDAEEDNRMVYVGLGLMRNLRFVLVVCIYS